jgi:hypothetical protein
LPRIGASERREPERGSTWSARSPGRLWRACASHVGVPAAAAFPATGMALARGPIARPKAGEHDPPLRGQCRSTTRALPHATEMAQPADED